MYKEMTSWKTGLCNCDCESNFLSWVVPCHVYAKLSKDYTSSLLFYLFLWINIHGMYFCVQRILVYRCPAYSTTHCTGLSDTCESHYMIMDGSTVACVYVADICTYNTMTCISSYIANVNIGLGLFFIGFLDIVICSMHYHLRKRIREEHQLSYDNDCLASTCCFTCGLAQEYRETI